MDRMQLLRQALSPSSCPWTGAAACATIYFAAVPLSAWITAAGLPVSLASGTALVVLQFLGVSYWPVVLAAAWLAAIAMGATSWSAGLLALTVLAEVLIGYAILRFSRLSPLKLRRHGRAIPATLVALAVPAVGATLMAAVSAPSHFWAQWRLLWAADAAGLLIVAPLWTRFPRETPDSQPAVQNAAEGLANLHFALESFEKSPRVVVTHTQTEPIQQHL